MFYSKLNVLMTVTYNWFNSWLVRRHNCTTLYTGRPLLAAFDRTGCAQFSQKMVQCSFSHSCWEILLRIF